MRPLDEYGVLHMVWDRPDVLLHQVNQLCPCVQVQRASCNKTMPSRSAREERESEIKKTNHADHASENMAE